MIGDAVMIGRVTVRPRVVAKAHRGVKLQPPAGDFRGQRIDLEDGQRRTLQYFRQQALAVTARAQAVVNRQMFNVAVARKLPAAA